MPHELFCLSSFGFKNCAKLFRIKFCTRKSNSFISEKWVWYLEKQPNLNKWLKLKKKNNLWHRKAQDRHLVGPNPLHIQHPRNRGSSIGQVRFSFRPFNLGPRPLFTKKHPKSAKSNPIFHLKGRRATELGWQIWIAQWLNFCFECFYFPRFWPSSGVKLGSKLDQMCKLWLSPVTEKIRIFQRFFRHCCCIVQYYPW